MVTGMTETLCSRIILCDWTHIYVCICWLSCEFKIFFQNKNVEQIKYLHNVCIFWLIFKEFTVNCLVMVLQHTNMSDCG